LRVILVIQNVNFVATIIMFGEKNRNDGTVWLLKSARIHAGILTQ